MADMTDIKAAEVNMNKPTTEEINEILGAINTDLANAGLSVEAVLPAPPELESQIKGEG